MAPPLIRVGDVLPWPADVPFDRHVIGIAMRARGKMAKAGMRVGASRNERESRARKIMSEHDEAERRANDPYELAKVFLGRRGYCCFDRHLAYGGDHYGFQVGKTIVKTREDVLNYARRLGWEG